MAFVNLLSLIDHTTNPPVTDTANIKIIRESTYPMVKDSIIMRSGRNIARVMKSISQKEKKIRNRTLPLFLVRFQLLISLGFMLTSTSIRSIVAEDEQNVNQRSVVSD